MKTLTLIAVATWSAALISLAAPANALVYTSQSGSYAGCTNWSKIDALTICGVSFTHKQQIKFVSSSCNLNQCPVDSYYPFVEFVYTPGRKITYYYSACNGNHIWGLGNCNC